MKLLLDLGNTRLKWGVADGEKLLNRGDIPRSKNFPRDFGLFLHGIPALDTALISSVAGKAADKAMLSQLESAGIASEWVVPQTSAYGVVNGYYHPHELGADRWVALVAARALTQDAVCVVDAGTAVTVDLLSGDGEFIGGLILPGHELFYAALSRGTAAIDDISLGMSSSPGRSTGGCISAGFICAITGAIECALRQLERTNGVSPTLLMTGGDAEMIAKSLSMSYRHEPDLVLHGLAFIGNTLR